MEKHTIDGESPVYERKVEISGIQSSTRHEKSRMNKRGPSRKAKYYLVTDSERVPWGKGEKYREQRGEIELETMRLQADGAYGWRRAFCIMSLRVTVTGKVNVWRTGAEAKASLKWAISLLQ